jgi:hypothetical protein
MEVFFSKKKSPEESRETPPLVNPKNQMKTILKPKDLGFNIFKN